MIRSLNRQILYASLLGIVLGAGFLVLGADTPVTHYGLALCQTLGGIFVGLLKMILVPLIFASIVTGIANLRQHQHMHTVWLTALGYFFSTTALAMLSALLVANLVQPGRGMAQPVFESGTASVPAAAMTPAEFTAQLLQGILQNPFSALAQGQILAIVVFALFLGIALVARGERYPQLRALFEEGNALCLQLINWIMYLAPWGIMALLAQLVATQPVALLEQMARLVVVVIGVTLWHGLVMLPLLLWCFTRKTPLWFFRQAREALITAFATSSSAATLPVSLRCAEFALRVKPSIAGFVLPLGATLNMDGTALYEAIAALFVAHLTGVELNFGQQLIVFVMAMLASIGAPGIPSAGMVTMVMVLQAVNLPVEAIALLLPVDRLMDTFRTMINVEGDLIGSLIVQQRVSRTRDSTTMPTVET